jgi:methionyl-tRNA formyltransferase
LRALFWGTPRFALPSLRALLGEGHDVVGVVTQPDRPAGRGRKVRPSPVKDIALEEGISVLSPEAPRGASFLDSLRALRPEISVVVAYGHILRQEVLELPERGSVNVHASLLPELRGAAPVTWAIVRGYDLTGITVMRMSEGMDDGPILLQREVPIDEKDSASGLTRRLAEVGAEAIVEALALLEVGARSAVAQDDTRVTYAPKVSRQVARVDWSRPGREVADHIRGMDAVPGAWTLLHEEPIKLFCPRVQGSDGGGAPGAILGVDPDVGVRVGVRDGSIVIEEVQPSSKRRMEAGAWLRGSGLAAGDYFR